MPSARWLLSRCFERFTNCDVSHASMANQELSCANRSKTEQCIRNSATSRNQDFPAVDSLSDPAVSDAEQPLMNQCLALPSRRIHTTQKIRIAGIAPPDEHRPPVWRFPLRSSAIFSLTPNLSHADPSPDTIASSTVESAGSPRTAFLPSDRASHRA